MTYSGLVPQEEYSGTHDNEKQWQGTVTIEHDDTYFYEYLIIVLISTFRDNSEYWGKIFMSIWFRTQC